MGDIAIEPGRENTAHHAVPLHFLRIVQFMPSGYAAGMEMAHPLNILLDRSDKVAFHDLHVIDVIKQLESLNSLACITSTPQAEWSHI